MLIATKGNKQFQACASTIPENIKGMSSPQASFSHVLRASEGKREEGVWKAGSPRPPQGFVQITPVLQA